MIGIGFYSRISMVVTIFASILGILVAILIGSDADNVAAGKFINLVD